MIHRRYKKLPWNKHKKDCYCDACFRHKCINKHKKQKKEKPVKGYIDYFDYINSLLWYNRKEKYYKSHKRQCQACGIKEYIDLHHMQYGNFGNEPDSDLITLCRNCHKEYHSIYKGIKTIANSKQFIENKQEYIRRIKTIWKEFDSKNKKGV